jgi:cellobiose phosphorylase
MSRNLKYRVNENSILPSATRTSDESTDEAIGLAKRLKKEVLVKLNSTTLLTELKTTEKILNTLYQELLDAEKKGTAESTTVQWVLDNYYLIRGHIKDVFNNLPKRYYRELPKVKSQNDLPKVYILALKLIEIHDGKLSFENIRDFLKDYQSIDYLTIGELWAFPLFLRLGSINCLKDLVIMASKRQLDSENAAFFGNRLLNTFHENKVLMPKVLNELQNQFSNPSPHFAQELLDHLFDEEIIITDVKKWLETTFHLSIQEILAKDQLIEAAEQVSMANSITSLIFLTQLDFRQIFKQVSRVEAILNEDPAGIFSEVSFKTSDMYLHAIERMSKGSSLTEWEVAKEVLDLCQGVNEPLKKHVGYYLIDHGKEKLEKKISYRGSFRETIVELILKHPTAVYLGLAFVLTAALIFFLIHYSINYLSVGYVFLFTLLAAIPASELIIQIQNIGFAILLKPFILPKLKFDNGLPQEFKTLVVVPLLLQNENQIIEDIKSLEIRYLANQDANLKFSLFSDFTDHKAESSEDDEKLIAVTLRGFLELEKKYGSGTFFLFHRKRKWNPAENAYIGEERKRGKLELLNSFLLGKINTGSENILYFGNFQDLENIRYVLTLDCDTDLPKNQAFSLIETIAHPLNEAHVDGELKKVLRGYTLIQPRVTTSLPSSNKTYFSRIFSGAMGNDPYTEAVSDIYQDMLHEGSYQGKGIYDLNVFHTVLNKRFPDNHLLSHDLIEGAYTRVGFASGIELLDEFPVNYEVYSKREHRWIRGDWQIADWLLPKVPNGTKKKVDNSLSYMNRWKIFDNLRRSLLPLSLFFLIILTCLLPGDFILWTTFAWILLFIPTLSMIIFHVFAPKMELVLPSHQIQNSVLKNIIMVSLLPYEAYLSFDAIVRAIYRKFISKKNLLQWSVNRASDNNKFISKMCLVSLMAVGAYFLTAYVQPKALYALYPFLFLWFISPLIVFLTSKKIYTPASNKINASDQDLLRMIARKTWNFFDEFVNEESSMLPPDNFQESYEQGVAYRTSPTNIGLYLLSIYTAYDFGYISAKDAFLRTKKTIDSILKLELYRGHLLNWYEIKQLQPLLPKYVSTVDSGNFLGCLWTLMQTIPDVICDEILGNKVFTGLRDTLGILKKETDNPEILREIKKLEEILLRQNLSLTEKIQILNKADDQLKAIVKVANTHEISNECSKYIQKLSQAIETRNEEVALYFSWVSLLDSDVNLSSPISLYDLSEGVIEGLEDALQKITDENRFKEFEAAFFNAKHAALNEIQGINETLERIKSLSDEMDMKFLYNEPRKVFSIGFNVTDSRLDNSYYDLLASEARLSSFISIAKNDAPLEHWFALGRSFAKVQGHKVLLSWGGTMFEYLMPLLLTKPYEKSLLDEACKAAVACQISYGNKRGIPWGISESAYSAMDARKTYQYQSFGVPKLGLKRGLDEDLVVSPYSTGLSLMVDSKSSIKNLKRLMLEMHLDVFDKYGFFESVDYTRQHGPHGERGLVIHTYMAHHQGMIFLSINNLLNNGIIQNRFHNDPRVMAIESLLFEKIPTYTSITKDYTKYAPVVKLRPVSPFLKLSKVETTHTKNPKVNLLSNGKYSLMLTNSGTGYSHYDGIEISRWSADRTTTELGSFCYIKDLEKGDVWSTTYQPTLKEPEFYLVNFTSDKVEFKRKDLNIITKTEIVISPEDNAEIRKITLTNLSRYKRHLELTSYLELSLAPHLNDRAHPAFNKMFIETSTQSLPFALIATRRLRSETEKPLFAAHIVTTIQNNDMPLQYETNRLKFMGRGNTYQNPEALNKALSNTTGNVLDPIFSIRHQLRLNGGESVEVAFVTLFADTLEKLQFLIGKYSEFSAINRATELAWTYSQLQLRHLRIHQEEAQFFQKLAGKIIYPQKNLRAAPERLKKNTLGQSSLWGYGVSGDLPIIAVTIGDAEDLSLVKQVLVAHSFINLRGFKFDIVFFNEEVSGYDQPLKSQISKLIQSHSHHASVEKSGSVVLLSKDQMQEADFNLFLSVARVVLISARGLLKDQLIPSAELVKPSVKPTFFTGQKESISEVLPFMELDFYNGIGGFLKDGSEYVIYLDAGKFTPAPWINVMATETFGVTVSESGICSSWFANSQTNRLTPWSNDAVLNPIADVIYLRDDDLGVIWSATPSPIRELDPYRIRHGQGYTIFEHNSHGINQELTVFVPIDDKGGSPVRIQRLRLKNITNKKRTITLMAYSELVLGENRESSGFFVVSEWEKSVEALLATNSYHSDYASSVTFASCSPHPTSYTADRVEFIGRNGTRQKPAALSKKNLLNVAGTALDPCMALQVTIELQPGETYESVFLLGQAPSKEKALALVTHFKDYENVESALQTTKKWWSDFLHTIYVETPDLSVNNMVNQWLLYQNLSCRLWGRSAFYQSSGAYGYRDQLQDVMALLYAKPELAREQILRSAAHQFLEGDVQHWWHPKSNGGIRTRITDDLLWLPFVIAQYIRVTGDYSVLKEEVTFLKGPLLEPHEHEIYFVPEVTKEKATILEHCRRAIKKGTTRGPHGIPLIGTGDWNDGMNRVGIHGKGESVWLGFFLIHVLNDFIEILEIEGNNLGEIASYKQDIEEFSKSIEEHAWDGNWYIRAFFDDGTPIGSTKSEETFIDSLPQSWSVISAASNVDRSFKGMESVREQLLKENDRLLLILTKPFDKTLHDPGYIKGYPPGIRENGGQYTHGSLWVPLAFARLRLGGQAVDILQILNPIKRTTDMEGVNKYFVEPYAIAADIYSNPSHLAKGGWTWYTGSAAWTYRIWIEEILGLKKRGDKLTFLPALPDDWKSFKVRYRHKSSLYHIVFEVTGNYHMHELKYYLDEELQGFQEIILQDDGKEHFLKITNV